MKFNRDCFGRGECLLHNSGWIYQDNVWIGFGEGWFGKTSEVLVYPWSTIKGSRYRDFSFEMPGLLPGVVVDSMQFENCMPGMSCDWDAVAGTVVGDCELFYRCLAAYIKQRYTVMEEKDPSWQSADRRPEYRLGTQMDPYHRRVLVHKRPHYVYIEIERIGSTVCRLSYEAKGYGDQEMTFVSGAKGWAIKHPGIGRLMYCAARMVDGIEGEIPRWKSAEKFRSSYWHDMRRRQREYVEQKRRLAARVGSEDSRT
jgi:hypothetical protein